jgi:hypothetical protein
MKSSGKFWLGLAAMAAAGSLLYYLFATDEGSGTRKKFYKKGKKFARQMEKEFEDLENRFSVFRDEIKTKFESAAGKNG